MRSKDEIQALLSMARENGLPWIEVDGVKMPVPAIQPEPQLDKNGQPITPEISLDPSSEYTDEEILFWSSPYFDELQDIKAEKEKHLAAERAERNPT